MDTQEHNKSISKLVLLLTAAIYFFNVMLGWNLINDLFGLPNINYYTAVCVCFGFMVFKPRTKLKEEPTVYERFENLGLEIAICISMLLLTYFQ